MFMLWVKFSAKGTASNEIENDSSASPVNISSHETVANESAAVSETAKSAVLPGPSKETSLLSGSISCTPPNTPKDCESFIEAAFKDVSTVHCPLSVYLLQKNCVSLSSQELNRLKTSGSKDRFQHQWVLDPNVRYCQKTGYFWLLYEEGVGVFCFLFKKHNKVNLQNKSKKFDTNPSVRIKQTAIIEHCNSQRHKSSVEAELTRSSTFHKEIEQREQ